MGGLPHRAAGGSAVARASTQRVRHEHHVKVRPGVGPISLVLLVLTLLSACSDDDKRPASVDTTRTTNVEQHSIPPPTDIARIPRRGEPLADGAHCVYLKDVDSSATTLTVDVIQWLSGDEADAAYAEERGDTSGAPNDYFIRNTSTELRTLPLASPEVVVAWDEHGPRQRKIGLSDLPTYLDVRRDPNPTFWITVDGGRVVRLYEQYRP